MSKFGAVYDGVMHEMNKEEFDKYVDDMTVGTEDIKNFKNASGRFGDLADDVEIIIDEMTQDEVTEFLGYSTISKNSKKEVTCTLTAKDAEYLADDSMSYIEIDPKRWIANWRKNNSGKAKVYMYADALKQHAFANIDAVGLLFLYLAIFIYNGEVSADKRITFESQFNYGDEE